MPSFDILKGKNDTAEKKQAITLTLTQDCNLRCRYCYEPNKSRDYYMSFDVARQAVIDAMRAKNKYEEVEFDFFGGEPMLAFDLIRELVDWFHTQKWEKGHLFFIGTNGTILTDEMKSWLVKHKNCVICGISLDGNKIAHDLNRSNSYDRVKKNR